jgi:hypothetical protein
MHLPDSEFRLIGVAAALGGLLVTMFAGQPSIASLSWGCLGLALFGVSRLMPRPRSKDVPNLALDALAVQPADTAEGTELDAPVDPKPGDLHAVLQRKVRVQRPSSPMIVSSVLPPSRASRSPSTP